LFEQLEAVGLLSFAFFADVAYEGGGLSVDDSCRVLFCFVGNHNEEVVEPFAALDYPIEELGRNLLLIEIVEDGNWSVLFFLLVHLEGRENLSLVNQFLSVELILELGELHLFGLVVDEVLAVLHDFKDGTVDPEATGGITVESQLQIAEITGDELVGAWEHWYLLIIKSQNSLQIIQYARNASVFSVLCCFQ
jgi:hypothetical protein